MSPLRLLPLLLAAGVAAASAAAPAAAQQPSHDPHDARAARTDARRAERERARAERTRERSADERSAERGTERGELVELGGLGTVVAEAVTEGLRGASVALRGLDGHVAALAGEVTRAATAGLDEALAGLDADLDADRHRDRDRDGDRRRQAAQDYRIDTTVSTGGSPYVDLSLISGPITVTTWNRSDVRVVGHSERIPLRFEQSGSSVRVWLESARESRTRGGDQRLEVTVPAGARLSARSVSGDVRIAGVRGEIEASAVSGDVEVRDAERRVKLSSVSGEVRGLRIGADVRANSVSGDVSLEDIGGEVDAQAVSGDVTLRRVRAPRVRAQSVSGTLQYDGTYDRDGRYEFSSHSGGIRLALPGNVGATLGVRTFSGTIDTAFPLTMQPGDGARGRDKRMEFTLGGGGARISAETFSGTIDIVRATAPR